MVPKLPFGSDDCKDTHRPSKVDAGARRFDEHAGRGWVLNAPMITSGIHAGTQIGESNRRVAWACCATGVLVGLVMGLWSFDGPMPVPGWLGEYGSTPRRLARLGHIAFMGLGILNLLLVQELRVTGLSNRLARVASGTMNFGNIALPVVLLGAAVWPPLKYLLSVPASAVFVSLVLAAFGAGFRRRGGPIPAATKGVRS